MSPSINKVVTNLARVKCFSGLNWVKLYSTFVFQTAQISCNTQLLLINTVYIFFFQTILVASGKAEFLVKVGCIYLLTTCAFIHF